jgi:circadian clock protein KaiB
MATVKKAPSAKKAAGIPAGEFKFVLKLYVTGMTPKSRLAIRNVQKLLDEHIPGSYELDIVDIYQQPELARANQLIAAPTLIKQLPLPLRRLIGDMSSPDRILAALAVKPTGNGAK